MIGRLTPPLIPATGYYRRSVSSALSTIVTPAANTKGIRLGPRVVTSYGDACRLMIKTSAPSAWNDSAAVTVLRSEVVSAVGNQHAEDSVEYVVPAGYGLYEQAEGVAASTSVTVAYEVLA